MRTFSIIVFIFSVAIINAQSKKEQIKILSDRVDSLNIVLSVERNMNTKKSEDYNVQINQLLSKITSLEIALNNAKNESKNAQQEIANKEREISSTNQETNRLKLLLDEKKDSIIFLQSEFIRLNSEKQNEIVNKNNQPNNQKSITKNQNTSSINKPTNNDDNFFSKQLSPGLNRNVLFTLKPYEVISERDNEYAINIDFKIGEKKIAAIIKDTLSGLETFIFNGKRVKTSEIINIYELDFLKENGFIVSAFDSKSNSSIFNIYGKEFRFEQQEDLEEEEEIEKERYKNDIYIDKRSDGEYFSLNGREFGPYNYLYKYTNNNLVLLGNGNDNYAFIYQKNYNWFININDKIFGPYENQIFVRNLYKNGNFTANYEKNGKNFLVVKDKIYGPYDGYINNLSLYKNGKFTATYEKNGEVFLIINDKIFGPYFGNISAENLYINGKFTAKYERNGEEFLILNGQLFGPYKDIWPIRLNKDGKFIFSFEKNDNHYTNFNNEIECKGHIQYYANEFNYHHFVGPINQDFDNNYFYLETPNKNHKLIINYSQNNVLIDGMPYGNSPAINAYYNEKQNAFVWLSQEGRDLVVYQFKL
jgi:hypothetical protein